MLSVDPPLLLSIVIPAHNEQRGIGVTIETIDKILREHALANEIIVVDDGSRDGTYEELVKLSKVYPNLLGVKLSRNFGKESALLAGLRSAKGNAIVTLDGDLQHPPTLIPEMVEAWRNGAKIVNAVKRERRSDGLSVRMRASVYGHLGKLLGGLDLRNSSDYKLLDRKVIDVITTRITEYERFYRGLVQWVGFKQVNLYFDVEERARGVSKFSLRALVGLAITGVVAFTSTPLRVVTVLGLVTMAFALAVTADALWSWSHNSSVSGFATIIITLLVIGSSIMISLGILGEYIAKIYEEIKNRPAYLVEEDTISRAATDSAAD
jgi:glycosyltransferase involved in cell wall biosynthesis